MDIGTFRLVRPSGRLERTEKEDKECPGAEVRRGLAVADGQSRLAVVILDRSEVRLELGSERPERAQLPFLSSLGPYPSPRSLSDILR